MFEIHLEVRVELVQRAVHANRHPPPADLVDETGDARARQVGRARRDALADVPHGPEVERRVGALGEVNRSGWIRVETRIVLERVMTRAF